MDAARPARYHAFHNRIEEPVRQITTLAFALLLAAGCSGAYDYGTGPSMGGTPGTDSVNVTNNAFGPVTVHPDSNGNVVWTWKSAGVTHNITFEDASAGSGDKSSGTFTKNFAAPGTYRYRCTIHSTAFGNGMHGSVVVP